MAAKTVPQHVNMPDTIINIYIEFATCPSDKDMMGPVEKMLQYDRMRQVPILGDDYRLRFDNRVYNKKQLVRRIVVNCDTQPEMIRTMEAHLHDPLNDAHGRGLLPWWEIVIFEVSPSWGLDDIGDYRKPCY